MEKEPSRADFLINFAVVIGCLLIFGILVYVAYVTNQPEDVNVDAVAIRTERYTTLKSEAATVSQKYEVLDSEKGVVRIPVERAIALTGERLQKGQKVLD